MFDTAERLGLCWDDVEEILEAEVYDRLFPGRGVHESVFAQPDWVRVRTELVRVGVASTLHHSAGRDLPTAGSPLITLRLCEPLGFQLAAFRKVAVGTTQRDIIDCVVSSK